MTHESVSPDPQQEIGELRYRIHLLRQTVADMETLLDRFAAAEHALRQSEEQFRLLVDGVRDYAIFTLETRGYITSWNTGAQLIKGYSADDIIGRHFSTFYPPEDVAARKPERELEIAIAEGVYKEEGWRIRKDGSSFWASVVLTALYDRGILRGFGKVTRDLTERKHAEDAQRQLQEQELLLVREQAAREQVEATMLQHSAFLSATAHELRTPVTSVLGFAQLLQRRLNRGDIALERLRDPVRTIAEQASRLDRVTTMLLDIARLEHGHFTLARIPLDLRSAIERIVRELQLLSERHTLTTDLPQAPLTIAGDELRLEQAIYNLVQNAIKYSPRGGTVHVTAQNDGPHAIVTVADEGIGIAPDALPHVFDRFYRATNSSSATISGLGLGLYLVKEFVTLHSGTIDVQSVVDQGTTFRMVLPLLDPGAGAPQDGLA